MTILTRQSPVARAARRAAVEAFSQTGFANMDPHRIAALTIDQITRAGQPSAVEAYLLSHASNLAKAYAALVGAAERQTIAALLRDAQQLYQARTAVSELWTRTCADSGVRPLEVRQLFLALKRGDPAMVAYTQAAGIPHELACQHLYEIHAPHCPQHATS